MNEMTRVYDLQAAGAYASERLTRGKRLARALRSTWDFSRGSVGTTINSALGPHNSLDFVQGVTLADVRKRGLKEPEDVLTDFIETRLSSIGRAALVVENQLDHKGDPIGPGRLPGRKGYLGRDIYCFLPAEEADRSVIKQALLWNFCPYFNLMILTSPAFSSHIPSDGDEIGEDVLEQAAARATTLIVGAYDEEAHVVWEREQT